MANAFVVSAQHERCGGDDFGEGGDVKDRIDVHGTPSWCRGCGTVSLVPDELPAMANADHRAGDEAIRNCLLEIGIEMFHEGDLLL
ncbi:MAG: hypothetical protein ETSY1_23685 [Candidatus Entotheonella factor]|uniref:Uncharacterized protein n=1 Tax=Entotheonella factor TaxID=1429438 RepID=W4LHH3_ENTF1|nr:MAG: hypothetical protein ETSY1_23685 [Candidatus Entotheonella factor]